MIGWGMRTTISAGARAALAVASVVNLLAAAAIVRALVLATPAAAQVSGQPATVNAYMLTSARARREEYVGQWLPEPVVDTAALAPDSRTELAEDLSIALLLTLDRLSPLERAALKRYFEAMVGFTQPFFITPCDGRKLR